MQQDDKQCDNHRTEAGEAEVLQVPLVAIGTHVAPLLDASRNDAACQR